MRVLQVFQGFGEGWGVIGLGFGLCVGMVRALWVGNSAVLAQVFSGISAGAFELCTWALGLFRGLI